MNIFKIVALIFVLIACAIAIHQFIFFGYWFSLADLHHETWMIMFMFCAVVLLALYGRN